MKIGHVEITLCSICVNRPLCLPEVDFPILSTASANFTHRDFVFFEEGDYLFKLGAPARGIFCVYHGSVGLYNKNGKEIVEEYPGAGDYIGFNSIVDGSFVLTAKTLEETFCCYIDMAEVNALIDARKPVAQKILQGY